MIHNALTRPIMRLSNEAVLIYYQPKRIRRFATPAGFIITFILIVILYRRHGHNKTPDWLVKVHNSLKTGADGVNIAVVEEHHEVLQYWFSAAQKGVIDATGNTLVHIDAHPDSGVPAEVPGFAQFRTPRTAEEIRILMQRNDVFITAAMYKDFIKEFIWIYPDWVESSEMGVNVKKGSRFTITLGVYTHMIDGQMQRGLCSCYKAEEKEDSCDFINDEGIPIEGFKGNCDGMKTIPAYFIKSSLVPRLLPAILANSPGSVVLDIDEDYYGVMRGSDLLDGIDFSKIDAFDKLLGTIFTIKNIQDESQAHKLLMNVLHMIKVTCSATIDDQRDCSQKEFRKIQKFVIESGLERIPIGNHIITQKELKQIVEFVGEKFTAQHIDQISQTGFCLRISPITYKVSQEEDFWAGYEKISVCHGINTPSSDNQIHVPKSTELETITDELSSIFDLIPTEHVKLVSVSRSNRDGFVPRHLQQDIEYNILTLLRGKFQDSHVIYDHNLMTHLGQGIR